MGFECRAPLQQRIFMPAEAKALLIHFSKDSPVQPGNGKNRRERECPFSAGSYWA
jgi:hypothetical protein